MVWFRTEHYEVEVKIKKENKKKYNFLIKTKL